MDDLDSMVSVSGAAARYIRQCRYENHMIAMGYIRPDGLVAGTAKKAPPARAIPARMNRGDAAKEVRDDLLRAEVRLLRSTHGADVVLPGRLVDVAAQMDEAYGKSDPA